MEEIESLRKATFNLENDPKMYDKKSSHLNGLGYTGDADLL